jgi:hypothetical protein
MRHDPAASTDAPTHGRSRRRDAVAIAQRLIVLA